MWHTVALCELAIEIEQEMAKCKLSYADAVKAVDKEQTKRERKCRTCSDR